MQADVDVLIVGAGPVGLLLATEMMRDGVRVLLIDRMATRSFFCKALGITPRTLEVFDQLHIAQEAIDAGIWLDGITTFTDGASGPAMDIPEGLPFGSLSLAQSETERVLEACLARHGGRVTYGWALTGFTQDANGVQADLAGPEGEAGQVNCRWLVGCDGAHSRVRAALGLDFPGGQYPQTFVLSDLNVDWALPRGRAYRFNLTATGDRPAQSMMAMPVAGDPRRHRLSTVLPGEAGDRAPPAGGEAPAPPTLEEITAVMAPFLPPEARLSHQIWSSTYRVSHRIVPHYAQGRVFLAGDAAHLHPPVGGLGMNTGLQDAHNLAWKLALACHDRAAQGLLDSYGEERRAVGLDVVENTSRALNAVLAQKAQMPGLRETQLLISYHGGSIVRDDSGEAGPVMAGDRTPDAGGLSRRHVEQAHRLVDRLGRGRHVVFGRVADAADLAALQEALRMVRDAMGATAGGFAIAAPGVSLAEPEGMALFHDGQGEFAAAYGTRAGAIWLSRPDGHVGWTGTGGGLAGLAAALALVARPPAA